MAELSERLDSALPYRCKKCRKRFRQASHLQQHARIHRSKSAFACSVCSRTFRLRKYLQHHWHYHPYHRPYHCYTCKLYFPDALQYYHHCLKVHRRAPLKTRANRITDLYIRKPPSVHRERHSLKLCLTSRSKPGSWMVSQLKRKTLSSHLEKPGLKLRITELGKAPALSPTSSPSSACYQNLDSADRRQTSVVSLKNCDKGASCPSADFSAVVTSVDHSGTSPKIRIEMSPRAYASTSPRSWNPHTAPSATLATSPGKSCFKCVTSNSPTSVKIVFLKNDDWQASDEQQAPKDRVFKRPIETDSQKMLSCKRNLNDNQLSDQTDIESGDRKEAKKVIQPPIKPFRINLNNTDYYCKSVSRKKARLRRSVSEETDDLPHLEKILEPKEQFLQKSGAGANSDEDACEDDEMPDDLSQHSHCSVNNYGETSAAGSPVFDAMSVGSASPPSLDRVCSSRAEAPPKLVKICCSAAECHKSLGALGIHCLGSPKDTGVSPQYLGCGDGREEAASIWEGSPPSDVDQANKMHDVTQFMLCSRQPSVPSPGEPPISDSCSAVAQQCVTQAQSYNQENPVIIPANQNHVSGFMSEFAKFIASKVSEPDECESEMCQDVHGACNKLSSEECADIQVDNDRSAAEDLGVDKYTLRPKKRNAGHCLCDCCFAISPPRKVKPTNARRLQQQTEKLRLLRRKVCRMLQVLFPELRYPQHFSRETDSVESLMEQIIKAARVDYGCSETEQSRLSVRWQPKVVLCKSPRKCLVSLRHKICRLLAALLPTLQLQDDFDRSGHCVDKLLDVVIKLNSV